MKTFTILFLIFSISLTNAQVVDNQKSLDSIAKLSKTEQLEALNSNLVVLRTSSNFDQKAYEEALNLFNDAIEKEPDNELYYGLRGNLYMVTRQFEKAIAEFSKSLQLTTDVATKNFYYVNRAAANAHIRNFESSYKDLLKAYEIDPNDTAVLVNLGAVADEIGQSDKTIFFLERAIAVDSTCFPAYGNLGYKYQEMGEHEKAIIYYNKVLELKPDEPLGYSNRAYNRLKIGKTEEALQDINTSIQLYPENSYAYMVRALISIEMNDSESACKDLDHALQENFTQMYGDRVELLKAEHCK